MHTSFLFLQYLAFILVGAKLASELFHRLKLSPVIGEILAGLLIGPFVLGLVPFDHAHTETAIITTLSELGVIFMLFYLGLEVNFKQIREVGVVALLAATGGVFLPFISGYALGVWMFPDIGWHAHLFIGTIMTATSIAITARVMEDYGLNKTRAARIILAAAVIDDILGLLILSLVLVFNGIGNNNAETLHGLGSFLNHTIGLAPGFGLSIILVGFFLFIIVPTFAITAPPLLRLVNKMEGKGALLVVTLSLMFTLAYISSSCGLAPIVGAFLFGMIANNTHVGHILEKQIEPIMLFLSPIFFVCIGLNINPHTMGQSWLFALILTAVAILSKFLGAGLPAKLKKCSTQESLFIGVGMVPRGEVGLIIANIGLAAHIITPEIFSATAAMCILTVVITPPFIKKVASSYTKTMPQN